MKSYGRVKSLAELRREARLKCFVKPHKANSHSHSHSIDGVILVSSVRPIGTNNNSRWYCNKLSTEPIVVIENWNDSQVTVVNAASNMHKAFMK